MSRKSNHVVAAIAILFMFSSCGAPSMPTQPQAVEVEPPVPQATPTLSAPTRTSTPYPTSTPRPAPTPTNTPSPTAPANANLPPLPDFRGSVVSSGEGGGPRCDDFYQGPPHVHGAGNAFVAARTGYVCIYGLSFDTDFRVELTAPDGSITLGGNYFVSSGDFRVYWQNFALSDFGSNAGWLAGGPPGDVFLFGEAYTRFYINTRWRGDLPAGTWQIRVLTANNEVDGEFLAVAPEYPSITVVDSRQDWIVPAYFTCHFANQPQDLSALAEGYPPNQDVYLYVYEQNDGLVLQSIVRTDSFGSFFIPIRGPYRQDGKYFLIGALQPFDGTNMPQGNMVDCFYVP